MHIGGSLQELINQLETGMGARVMRVALVILAVVGMGLLWDLRALRDFSAPEAMDAAQVARNLAQGKGYTTLFIRPFSLYLVQTHNEARSAGSQSAPGTDFAHIQTGHPDLANPPVYPTVLAGLMKLLPFNFNVETSKPFWSDSGRFQRYQPEFLMDIFNELLLMVVVVLTFLLARKLFDSTVAWISTVLVFGCAQLWQFSLSGLSTMMLIVLFLGLAWCIWRIEALARETPGGGRLLGWVAAAGALTGVGALTRYSFGGLIIPVVVFLILFGGPRRVPHAFVALAAFLLVLMPWVIRNLAVSGTPFGTAGYAMAAGATFPATILERSAQPNLASVFSPAAVLHKGLVDIRDIFEGGLPKLGGSWASMLFLAGLLLGFRSMAPRRMRYFLLMSLGMLIIFQAFGRTGPADEATDVSADNLIVLAAPLVFIYGVVIFQVFLEQMKLPLVQLHYAVIILFVALCWLPMVFTLLVKASPLAFPPYYPPDIQQISGAMGENELLMSDIPWAVAWYGRHECVWLTANAQDDFNALSDTYLKPVQGLYLTTKTLDSKFYSDMALAAPNSWGRFLLQAGALNHIPPGFPLKNTTVLPSRSGMFLSDRQRQLSP